ncbi:LysR family transcriptional regulator [Acetobacter nitrogenifigens DSM 23921 = NBRC 105050]|nr:LysR family transcriptional regulator [Acetobacter nitrogenifigens]GBQ92517.1 LysR family transcriptional regulator [Acetobacter nitrogenifigens DSM 23921 = NBRC 105050]
MNVDSRDLRYFEVIAELGHLRLAAEQLHLSQPALSKCVRRLESAIGARLFEREGRGIRLTAVGDALLQQARRLNLMTTNALREIQEFAAGGAGVLRIGCGPVMSELMLPAVCEILTRNMPNVKVTITVGMNYILRDELRHGNIDAILGLVTDADEEFSSHPLLTDTVVIAATQTHRLFRRKNVSIADLADEQWVLPVQQVASRVWLDERFKTYGLPPPKARMEVNATPLLLPMIAHSGLVCFVSRHILGRQLQAPYLKELPIETLTMQRKLGLTTGGTALPPAVLRFVSLMESEAPNFVHSP